MASKSSHLRSVKPGDEPPPKPAVPVTIATALDGSSRDVLASMRLALAKKIDAGDLASNAIASAYKELRELDRQVRALDAEAKAEEEKRGEGQGERRSYDPSAI